MMDTTYFQMVQEKNITYINIKRKWMIKQMRPNVNKSLNWVKNMQVFFVLCLFLILFSKFGFIFSRSSKSCGKYLGWGGQKRKEWVVQYVEGGIYADNGGIEKERVTKNIYSTTHTENHYIGKISLDFWCNFFLITCSHSPQISLWCK